jgi:hypothetical protein
LHIPVNLTADAADYLDVPSPEIHLREKAPDIQHPVIRVFRMDKIDLGECLFEMVIHSVQFVPICQPWHAAINRLTTGQNEFVTDDHNGLGQIQRGKTGCGYGYQNVAGAEFGVGQPTILGTEEQGHLIILTYGDQLFTRRFQILALTSSAGSGPHHTVKRLQGGGQVRIDHHVLHHMNGRTGGHLENAGPIWASGGNQHESGEPHIAGCPRHCSDVLGKPRPMQNNSHSVEVVESACPNLLHC